MLPPKPSLPTGQHQTRRGRGDGPDAAEESDPTRQRRGQSRAPGDSISASGADDNLRVGSGNAVVGPRVARGGALSPLTRWVSA